MVRADHDASIILTCDAQSQFASCVTNDRRHGNGAARAVGGDPYGDVDKASFGDLARLLVENPGVDISRLAMLAGAPQNEEESDPDVQSLVKWTNRNRIDDLVLAAAYEELRRAPKRPRRADSAPWVPGRDLKADNQVRALDGAVTDYERSRLVDEHGASDSIPAESASARSNNGHRAWSGPKALPPVSGDGRGTSS